MVDPQTHLRGGPRDGIDLIEVHNGALSYSLLPTRGMGLWRGEYRGNYLGWKAPVLGPVHPKFVDLTARGGIGFLDGFDEWMCRCGLASNGPPGEDAFTDKDGVAQKKPLTLHGQIANLPADFVEVRVSLDPPWRDQRGRPGARGSLFTPRLSLTSVYTTVPGSNRLIVMTRWKTAPPSRLSWKCCTTSTSARRFWKRAAAS